MRLIDADSFISFMKNYQKEIDATGTHGEYNLLKRIIKGMENEPTAYDVENVIKDIDMESFEYYTKSGAAIDVGKAEDIIRKGGV